jgi:CHAT domain-containing protein
MRGYLRYATDGARAVASYMRKAGFIAVTLKEGADATWSAVVEGLNTSNLAHLSLHAIFKADNPLLSALLVAPNARLYLRDLLDHRQVNLSHLRLAVLSVCQSGLGDFRRLREEAVGFFGAMLAGGAAGVVGTLWPVYDSPTAALMESFIRRYLLGGQEPYTALRDAMREIRGLLQADQMSEQAPASPAASEEWHVTMEEVPEGELISARQRWEQLRATDLDPSRQLPLSPGAEAGDLADAARRSALDHPIHWAALVYYGA